MGKRARGILCPKGVAYPEEARPSYETFARALQNGNGQNWRRDKENGSKQDSNRTPRKCYSCSRYGHIAPNYPPKDTKGSNISREGKNDRDRDRKKSIASMIKNVSSMGLKVKKTKVLSGEIVGELVTVNAEMLEGVQAVLDTGSMISILPLRLLGDAYSRGRRLPRKRG